MKSREILSRTAARLRAANLKDGAGRGKRLPALLFFTDPRRTARPEAVVARLPRGAGVIFRAFGAADALERGRAIARAARARGVLLFVGADVGLAVALNADGVHLPERLAGRRAVHRALRRRFILTAAAHGQGAVRRACRAGVDALVVSPVFPSRSPSAGRPLGVMRFGQMARGADAPVYALGGLDARTARRLTMSGAVGLAAVEGLSGDS